MELITAIALLCQLSAGASNATTVEHNQTLCQKYYAKCVLQNAEKTGNDTLTLLNCIDRLKP